MPQILLVGTVTLDLVFSLDHHPSQDEEMRAQSLRMCRGGNAANTAVVLAALGHAPTFLGVMAEAPENAVIVEDFARWGVRVDHCPRLSGRPPTSSIYLTRAHRSIVHCRDLPELSFEHFNAVPLAQYQALHFEGRNVPVLYEMLRHAKSCCPSLPISIELEKYRDGIERVFDQAHLLICSKGFAHHYGHDDPQAFLQWMATRARGVEVIVAWGEQGAYGLDRSGGIRYAPAHPPAQVVDTLGAGDTFNAGVLSARLQGLELQAQLASGCRIAGIKCGVTGFDLGGTV